MISPTQRSLPDNTVTLARERNSVTPGGFEHETPASELRQSQRVRLPLRLETAKPRDSNYINLIRYSVKVIRLWKEIYKCHTMTNISLSVSCVFKYRKTFYESCAMLRRRAASDGIMRLTRTLQSRSLFIRWHAVAQWLRHCVTNR
jgi:hypothetical protein